MLKCWQKAYSNQHNQLNGTTVKSENKGNFNFDSNWNLPIGTWNLVFKNTDMGEVQ